MILPTRANGPVEPLNREIILGSAIVLCAYQNLIEHGDSHRGGMNPASVLGWRDTLEPDGPGFIDEVFGSFALDFEGDRLMSGVRVQSQAARILSIQAVGQSDIGGGKLGDEDFCVSSALARTYLNHMLTHLSYPSRTVLSHNPPHKSNTI